jgi:fructose-bisphosphate aldolase class II
MDDSRLYTQPEEVAQAYSTLSKISPNFTVAAAFGNVHGVYKPGNVKLKPSILKDSQDYIEKTLGTAPKPVNFVFHGGSGSTREEIREAIGYGAIKMNLDTDTQYAFTRSVADTMFTNYSGVLKVDGEVGNKKVYDPRSWGKLAETAMASRVVDYAKQLGSVGHALSR